MDSQERPPVPLPISARLFLVSVASMLVVGLLGLGLIRWSLSDARPEPRAEQAFYIVPLVADLTSRRFLSAHAFANWAIHLGSGLESWLLSIETANAFLQAGAGVRHADLVLRHLTNHESERW